MLLLVRQTVGAKATLLSQHWRPFPHPQSLDTAGTLGEKGRVGKGVTFLLPLPGLE